MEPNLTFPEGGGDVRAREKTPPASQSLKRPEVGIKVITFLRKVCYCFSTRKKQSVVPPKSPLPKNTVPRATNSTNVGKRNLTHMQISFPQGFPGQ